MKKRTQDMMKDAEELINRIFGDTSVPKEDTREALETLHDDIEMKLAAIDEQ